MRIAHAPGMPGAFSLPPRFIDSSIHFGACATHNFTSLVSGKMPMSIFYMNNSRNRRKPSTKWDHLLSLGMFYICIFHVMIFSYDVLPLERKPPISAKTHEGSDFWKINILFKSLSIQQQPNLQSSAILFSIRGILQVPPQRELIPKMFPCHDVILRLWLQSYPDHPM